MTGLMRRLIITFCTLVAVAEVALAEPANYASRRYLIEFQGSVLKATQFLEYIGTDLASCNSLLNFADGLNPKEQTVVRGCTIARAAPDGSATRPNPSPDDFYITYEDPVLRGRTPKTFTVYLINPSQMAAPGICQQLIASFHGHQVNSQCHVPISK